ncbi:MAG: hypothetical protein J6B86_04565 [Clostridia bacterium]|nr:hypothetical protein [Clostridia bacterium]
MTILFAGGDKRTLSALAYMKSQGFSVCSYALTDRVAVDATSISAVVLPFPCLKNGRLNAPQIEQPPTLSELIEELGISTDLPIIGGPIPNHPFSNYVDLSLREDLKLRNAVTTVEGAVSLLIHNTDRAIFGMNCLVLGYGAIGKRLSSVLSSLGASVTVAARKQKDRVDATMHGFGAMDVKALELRGFQAVFNTVPHVLLTREILQNSEPDAVLFELASAPGGIDRTAAAELQRTVLDGPALPGKVAPVTAGEDLAKTVIDILQNL